jgi:hypothetical protein
MFTIRFRLTIPAMAFPASEADMLDQYMGAAEAGEVTSDCPNEVRRVVASAWLVTRDGRTGSTCLN